MPHVIEINAAKWAWIEFTSIPDELVAIVFDKNTDCELKWIEMGLETK